MGIRDPATAKIGEEILPFEMETVPEYFQKKAEAELHDTPDRRAQGLRQIRELAKNDKHTKNIEFDDDFLLQYLRVRKYNVARAFSQLKALVALKKRYPLIFTNFSYDKTVKTISDKFITMLPWRCQDGCAILLVELDNWIPEEFPVEEIKRAVLVYLLQSLRYPMTQINGFKAILDLKSNPLRHLKHCTPNNIYLIYHGSQECIAGRYKEVHIVNQSVTFKAAWFLVKPFLTDKLKKAKSRKDRHFCASLQQKIFEPILCPFSLIIFHSSPETLLDYFPKAVLPKQYGGDLENYDMYAWLKKAMEPEKLSLLGGRPRQVIA